MQVLAINSSPKMEKSNTDLILKPFLEGMKAGGAEVELFYTRKLNINPCTGELDCWLKTPGKCYQRDDMDLLYPKIDAADLIVFATPVYVDGVTGPMKNLIDRMLPRVEPFFEIRDAHCRHRVRGGPKPLKFVLVSNCGFWEMDNFDSLLVYMKAFCKNASAEFAGALLRPHGEALPIMLELGEPIAEIFKAAKKAGFQLAQGQEMSQESLDTVSRELLPKERYVQIVNQYFQQCLETPAKQ
ncbi:MAG: flavodoxin family protein [Methanosarcinaceae archaeon]|nr:flavodoxin family protein [Methanosarcinaceae archaeon]MDD4330744.1 flavodoxin family protein [Methanosarcinaceae archaeon]MDD4748976.1 flavodoxin family protein [Methanosarcinaceae archaeon]